MNWLKRSQNSVSETLMAVVNGSMDIQKAYTELQLNPPCDEINYMAGAYPAAQKALIRLSQLLRCHDMQQQQFNNLDNALVEQTHDAPEVGIPSDSIEQ